MRPTRRHQPSLLRSRLCRLAFEALESREVPASLAGRVFLDFDNSGAVNGPDTGISGVTLTLSGGGLTTPLTTHTDAQGNYSFGSLAAGTYTLTETQPTAPANQTGKATTGSAGGSTATANVVSSIVLSASATATGYNFAEIPLVGTGGAVFEDKNGNGVKDSGEPGVPNVTITLSGVSVAGGVITPKTATTDANGNYTFTGLTPGTYMLVETQPTGFSDGKDQNGTPAATSTANDRFLGIDLTKSAAASSGFNFGEVKGGILSGVVFQDVNNDGTQAATGEPGIAGVKVRLTGTDDQNHAVDRTTTTGSDGSYFFDNLRPGTYALQETQPAAFVDGKEKAGTLGGSVATNDQITGIQFASGASATGYLFGEQPRADLVLSQSAGAATINPGGTVTITYTLRNKGTATATASTVLVNFGGLTFVSASTPAAFNPTTRTWTVGDLAASATQTIRLTFRAPVAGTFGPTAHAATTATELRTTNDASGSTISVGVPTPAPVTTPTFMSGPSIFANLFAAFNQYNPLTRLWLFNKFFG
jgi:SdrD B-like domain/Domain of unknown function DUF11